MDENKKKKLISKESPEFRYGFTFFIFGLLLILSIYFINHFENVKNGLSTLNGILMPFYLGFIMAFLLCPIYNMFTKFFYKLFSKKAKNLNGAFKGAKALSTIISLLVILIVIFGIIALIVPQVINTIVDMVPKIEPAFNEVSDWFYKQLKKYPDIATILSEQIDTISGNLVSFVKDKILPHATDFVTILSSGVAGTVSAVVDFLVALISCIYFLNGKETFLAQIKKIILSLFKKERAEKIFEFGEITNAQFSGFINGKIVDSIIIGLMCAVLMLILRIPDVALISTIVGVTNVIPFFGPFIGAIPSALILVFVNPTACLKFIIMILILQQFDGNFLTPQIVGKTTKLGSFWVMFSILVGGGFFGFIGMIIGVPLFAIIYIYIARFVDNRLIKKELASDTLSYENYSEYDNGTGKIKMTKRQLEKAESKKANDELKKKLMYVFSKIKKDDK